MSRMEPGRKTVPTWLCVGCTDGVPDDVRLPEAVEDWVGLFVASCDGEPDGVTLGVDSIDPDTLGVMDGVADEERVCEGVAAFDGVTAEDGVPDADSLGVAVGDGVQLGVTDGVPVNEHASLFPLTRTPP